MVIAARPRASSSRHNGWSARPSGGLASVQTAPSLRLRIVRRNRSPIVRLPLLLPREEGAQGCLGETVSKRKACSARAEGAMHVGGRMAEANNPSSAQRKPVPIAPSASRSPYPAVQGPGSKIQDPGSSYATIPMPLRASRRLVPAGDHPLCSAGRGALGAVTAQVPHDVATTGEEKRRTGN